MSLPDPLSLDNFGGIKEDYSPIEDPTTDRSADEVNQAFAATAAMTNTASRAFLVFTADGYADGTVDTHCAVWGSADSVLPTISRVSTGILDLTWPASITDDFAEVIPVNLRTGWSNVAQTSACFHNLEKTAPNAFRLRLFNSSGVANDLVGSVVSVFVL